jgi:hypothetical protein
MPITVGPGARVAALSKAVVDVAIAMVRPVVEARSPTSRSAPIARS